MKKTKLTVLLLIPVMVFAACIGVHTSVFAGNADDNAGMIGDEISGYVKSFRDETRCDSVSVAVVTSGDVRFYGDKEGLYQIGSMTKAFTGLAVVKLISEGRLSYDDNVSDLLPGFEAYYHNAPAEIKVEHLLSQTSGYTNEENAYPSAGEGMSLNDWVMSISRMELRYEPGEEYAYSNVNYNLLGAIIEEVTGDTYADYMYDEILHPLGLNDTYVGMPQADARIIPGSRPGYRHTFEYEIPVYEGRIPAGYFYSNVRDMARWLQIWMGTADVPEEFADLITLTKSSLNEEGDYFSGWELFPGDVFGHSGGTPNYSSRIVFSEKDQTGVCVLTDMNVAASTDSLCNSVYAIASGDTPTGIATDVWTVFDLVFTALSVFGILMLSVIIIGKRKGIVISTGIASLVLLLSICITMPLIFGAGLREIAFTWAPLSFSGGLVILALNVTAGLIRSIKILKNENRKKAG
jgi:CubicO group peptidase (beta-lactamase class C family)